MMLKRGLKLFFLFCISLNLYSQEKKPITGNVFNKEGEAVVSVTLTLNSKKDSTVISFTRTNSLGQFSMSLPTNVHNLSDHFLKASCLGYESQEMSMEASRMVYDFILNDASINLPNVVVEGALRKIRMHGDTLSYKAAAFSTVNDRSIGDVLKKLPGIEVEENGRIRFNGRSISKLYIEGDDFMGGKYGIGTRAIPHRVIDEIQVIENHQSIKALEGKVYSDDVAINLSLRSDANRSWVGELKLGGGLPELYEEEINALSLKKRHKSMNNLFLNNAGKETSSLMESMSLILDRQKQGFSSIPSQLSVSTGGTPILPSKRYLFNNSALLNTMNSWRLPNESQLRASLYYAYDKQQINRRNEMMVQLPKDTISYLEALDNHLLPQAISGDFIYERNIEKAYFRNKSAYDYQSKGSNATVRNQELELFQEHHFNSMQISNEFNYLKSPTSKSMNEFYSYITYQNSPDKLKLDNGNYSELFNTEKRLMDIQQDLRIPVFFTNSYFTKRFFINKLSQSYQAGISTDLKEFHSSLHAVTADNSLAHATMGKNDLNYKTYLFYLRPQYQWRTERFMATANLDFTYQLEQMKDADNQLNQDQSRFLFGGNLTLKYDFNNQMTMRLNFRENRNAGNMLFSYKGWVLKNYRTLNTNADLYPENKNRVITLSTSFKRPIQLFFINTMLSYQKSYLNTIAEHRYMPFLSYSSHISFNNASDNINGQLSFDKYIFSLGFTIRGSTFWQRSIRNQIINEEGLPFISFSSVHSLGIVGKVFQKLDLEYDFKINHHAFEPKNNGTQDKNTSYKDQRHILGLDLLLFKDLFMKFSYEKTLNKSRGYEQNDFSFMDVRLRYSIRKIKTDIDFELNNIMNIKQYQTINNTSNYRYLNGYPLRGRQALIKAGFMF